MNSLEIFRTHIEAMISASLNSWDKLAPILQMKESKKGDLIVRESQEYPYEMFLVEGVIRVLLTDQDGNEVNIAFYEGPVVIAPYYSRNINNKHMSAFQALEKCRMILFDTRKFSDLIRQYIDIRAFAYQVVDKELKLKTFKEQIFVTRPAAVRLEFFRQTYPGLENRIPLHHIASYLGISQVSLSRLRNPDTK